MNGAGRWGSTGPSCFFRVFPVFFFERIGGRGQRGSCGPSPALGRTSGKSTYSEVLVQILGH